MDSQADGQAYRWTVRQIYSYPDRWKDCSNALAVHSVWQKIGLDLHNLGTRVSFPSVRAVTLDQGITVGSK
jgi:hypothetical protein